jgi:hypothetical protein
MLSVLCIGGVSRRPITAWYFERMVMRYKKQDMRPGLLIVRGQHADAQVYTVKGAPVGNIISLVWFEGSRKCSQQADYSGCYKPTIEQIEYSINANGRLAGIMDVAEVTFEAA